MKGTIYFCDGSDQQEPSVYISQFKEKTFGNTPVRLKFISTLQ